MAEITVDETRLPIVVITYPTIVTFAQLRSVFAKYELLSRRNPRLAYLVDLTQLDPVKSSAEMLRSLRELFTAHRPALARVTVCEARVVPGGLLRTGLDAFDAITSGKWPCANFATRHEAEAWVKAHLARADAARQST